VRNAPFHPLIISSLPSRSQPLLAFQIQWKNRTIKPELLSAANRHSHADRRRDGATGHTPHLAARADDSATNGARCIDGHVWVPAPRVGAFAISRKFCEDCPNGHAAQLNQSIEPPTNSVVRLSPVAMEPFARSQLGSGNRAW
jgi:hypothetical protein